MSTEEPILTVAAVNHLMQECLAGQADGGPITEVLIRSFVFDKNKIEHHKKDIHKLLMELHPTFRKSVGGGWTFLKMSEDKDGNIWGQQLDAEALLGLGIAAGLMEIVVPRELWDAFPGAVPYVAVDDGVVLE